MPVKKPIELILLNKNQGLQFIEKCKLCINKVSKFLLIQQFDEIESSDDIKYIQISALFKWQWKKVKNILIVFGENSFQDFCLVFPNERKCKKVFDIICKHKNEQDVINQKTFLERFLIPVFDEEKGCPKVSKIFVEWIKSLDSDITEEYKELMTEHGIQNIQLSLSNDTSEKRNDNELSGSKSVRDNRKRRHASSTIEADNQHSSASKSLTNISTSTFIHAERIPLKKKYKKVINESEYKITFFKCNNGLYRGLLVFTSPQRQHCYEYNWSSKKGVFFCRGCGKMRRSISAKLIQNDGNGNEIIKLENKLHVCQPLKYNPEKYSATKIVRKPNYEILNNCKAKKFLIIFKENDRSKCYEFFWDTKKQYFACCECHSMKKHLSAEIYNENAENEYIMLKDDSHICEMRTYDAEKYEKFYGFVLKPNYEIRKKIKNGIEVKDLIILDENDKSLCYIYHYDRLHRTFYCNGCHKMNKNVYAKECVNEDGEEYILLSHVKHVCTVKPYIKDQTEIILCSPNIKFMETTTKNVPKLFIFENDDRKQCYIFSSASGSKSQIYNCLGCLDIRNSRNLKEDEHLKNVVQVYLCKNDENGEYFVRMKNGQTHICKPRKYEPEKHEEIKLKFPDYFLFKEKGSINLAIKHASEKDMCYKLYRSKSSNLFICSACKHYKPEGIFIYAKLQKDSDGNEYVSMSQRKHICKPLKLSSIKKAGTVILEKSGFNFEESILDEKRIVKIPNFELQKSEKGFEDRKLILFKSDDRSLCYSYKFSSRLFRCYKCDATAKLQTDKKNEKYIYLSKKEHTCLPIKYVPEKMITDPSDFMVFNREAKNNRPTKLVIFTSESKELCYEYTFCKTSQRFRCCECRKLKLQVSAKLLFNKNGKEYVQLYKNDHICTPKKFVLEEFEIKVIPESDFEFHSNRNGKPNSAINLFDSEKDGYIYEFRVERDNYFVCWNCKRNGKNVTVKLLENQNGEKFLEVLSNQHICESIKYDQKIYKK